MLACICERKKNSLLVGVETGIASLEFSVEVLRKGKNISTMFMTHTLPNMYSCMEGFCTEFILNHILMKLLGNILSSMNDSSLQYLHFIFLF